VGGTALLVLTVNTLLLVTLMLMVGWTIAVFTGGKVLYYCRLLAEQTGMAIAASCFVQALGGHLHKPKNWLDVSAWLLGSSWVLLSVLSAVFTLL
jgi:hypothetical protein